MRSQIKDPESVASLCTWITKTILQKDNHGKTQGRTEAAYQEPMCIIIFNVYWLPDEGV